MTYREQMKLYKNNGLDENERKALEEEIEKHEAISDYLFEQAELPVPESVSEPEIGEDGGSEEFEKQVKTYIRRAFVKTGAVVGAAVLAVLLFVIFALPKIVDCFYYDPGETVGSTEWSDTNRMSLDTAVYTELFVPGNYRENVTVEDEGYGNYGVYIGQNSSYTGYFTDIVGKVSKGRLTLYNPNVLKRPTGNAFLPELAGVQSWYKGRGAAGTPEEAFEVLDYLAEGAMYTAYVTLDKAMSLEEFNEWCGANEAYPNWCAVCIKADGNYSDFDYEIIADNMGFLYGSGCTELAFDGEKYPNLSVFALSEALQESGNPYAETQKHIVSLLRYTADNPEFAAMMGNEIDSGAFNRAADIIEADGVYIYGFAMLGGSADIQQLKSMSGISYVYTVPMQ